MAFQISVASPHGGTNATAYIEIYELLFNLHFNRGRLEIAFYKDSDASSSDDVPTGIMGIIIGNEEITDEDNAVTQIPKTAIANKTVAQIYTWFSTRKIRFKKGNVNVIVDLSAAVQV